MSILETIGAIIVTLQVALILLFTPTLAAGLISGEIESGGWDLLRTTPLSAISTTCFAATSALSRPRSLR